MLKKLKKMKPVKQIAFAVLIAFAVVCFWRGAWGLVDTYLFPSNRIISLWASLVLGLSVLRTNPQVSYSTARHSGTESARLGAENRNPVA